MSDLKIQLQAGASLVQTRVVAIVVNGSVGVGDIVAVVIVVVAKIVEVEVVVTAVVIDAGDVVVIVAVAVAVVHDYVDGAVGSSSRAVKTWSYEKIFGQAKMLGCV